MRATDAAIRVIETAYASAADESGWLDAVLGELDGLGLGGWLGYTVDGARVRTIRRASASHQQAIESFERNAPPDVFVAAHVPSPRVDHATARIHRIAGTLGLRTSVMENAIGARVPAMLGVLATDAAATGAMLLLPEGVKTSLPSRTTRLLSELSVHIAAALRLRRRLAPDDAQGTAAAVLLPTGELAHGGPDEVAARESLAFAVRNIECARGARRRLAPEDAVARWTGLVEGRWSLVDHVERDGKRFLLAHRNDSPSNIATLRAREAQVVTLAALGHSDKHIAYELGIQRSTVATHLRRALAKLRLPTRGALVRTLGPLARLRGGTDAPAISGPDRRA